MRGEFELTVEGKLECLPIISDFIAKTMRELNIQNSRDINEVQLSVDEACTNIIQHGYANKTGGRIVIRCMLLSKDNQFVVRIMDFGKPFDPTTVPKPDTQSALENRKEGGLGIFFIRNFMDSIKYTSIQNVNNLVMAKNLKERQKNGN
jgi:anti-sigma regulatory factor (Ser/Thr protein kinase)